MASIGYVLSHEQFLAPDLITNGIKAEQAGFDMVWTSDHFHPWMHNQGHSGHPWVTLAALGQRATTIPMGTGVTCPTYRYHPAIVAQAFASLGVLYPGRVFLGLGTGEAVNEEAATGAWGDYDERNARLEEAVALIRQLWAGDWVSFDGDYYQTKDAHLYDLPEQPIPIYVAAGGDESAEMAGRIGDGLITGAQSAVQSQIRQAFHKGAEAAGKNPDETTIHAETWVFVGRRDEAEHAVDQWRFIPKAWSAYVNMHDPRAIAQAAREDISTEQVIEKWSVVSPEPEEHIRALQNLIDNGVTHIYIHSGQKDQQMVLDFYGQRVLPHIEHAAMAPQPAGS